MPRLNCESPSPRWMSAVAASGSRRTPARALRAQQTSSTLMMPPNRVKQRLDCDRKGGAAVNDHATVTCGSCERVFDAAMPLSRAGLARSSLMFLVEVCPHCAEVHSYLKSDYSFALPDHADHPLSA